MIYKKNIKQRRFPINVNIASFKSVASLVSNITFITLAVVVLVQEGSNDKAGFDISIHDETWISVSPNLLDNGSSNADNNFDLNLNRRLDEDMNSTDSSTSTAASEISVNVSFEDILKTVVFLIATWLAANVCKLVGLPSLAGEIIAGVVLGPPVLDFCPYPEAMVLIGSFGLIGLILNSGIDLDIAQLRETGTRAVMIAASGTVLGLSTGIAMSYVLNTDSIQSAFSVGAAFAPSSWGVASQVLSNGEVLNTPVGQTIMASSVVDDILGLVLLSLLQVFVEENPTTFDYIKPFIASFGYLVVLGGLGITIIPRLIQNYILPRFTEEKQDHVAIALMFLLMTVYLPIMNYSGASYLTGAFLAGVSFSQLHHVHATFGHSSREIMVWLMRIFFAATIGFQVPASYFNEPSVLRKGFLFLIPVFSKFPLGFLIPRFHRETPTDFPYSPYWRDFWITSFSMLCRGEFNFVVAAVALEAELLDAEQYAGIVFAVLISCIVSPLLLSRIIQYYNKRSVEYLNKTHPVQRIGNTCDGYRPLFLAIQARIPIHWGWHDKLRQTLESAGLIIIDHRSWHTLGYKDAVDITEIFCQDTMVQVKISGCFASKDSSEKPLVRRSNIVPDSRLKKALSSKNDDAIDVTQRDSSSSDVEALISERKAEIRELIIKSLGEEIDSDEYAIQVSEWETFSFQRDPEQGKDEIDNNGQGYCFHSSENVPQSSSPEVNDGPSNDQEIEADDTPIQNGAPLLRKKHDYRRSMSSPMEFHSPTPNKKFLNRSKSNASAADSVHEDPHLTTRDLWETDEECHYIAREGYYQTPVSKDGSTIVYVEEGCHQGLNRPRADSQGVNRQRADSSAQLIDSEDQATPSSASRRNRFHQRSHTFDASVLDTYNLETYTIKERLHGYVR